MIRTVRAVPTMGRAVDRMGERSLQRSRGERSLQRSRGEPPRRGFGARRGGRPGSPVRRLTLAAVAARPPYGFVKQPTLRRPGRGPRALARRGTLSSSVPSHSRGGRAPGGARCGSPHLGACHDAARLRRLARRLAPNDAGRSPLGALPRYLSTRTVFCADNWPA